MFYYNPATLTYRKNQRIRQYEINLVSTRYTLIDYFNRALQFKWKRYNMISGGAWSWERADALVMGSGINWVRCLGVVGYFSPLNSNSAVTTLRAVCRLNLKKATNKVISFATSPESFVGNELYNFNRKLQYRLIETMYSAVYVTKSSVPRAYYSKNNFTVSEIESMFFEECAEAVCPFFAEIVLLDKIKNNCPVAYFDKKWRGVKNFSNLGPRTSTGLEPEKNSILHKLLTKRDVYLASRGVKSKTSVLGFFMKRHWWRSIFNPYRMFAFEKPKYRFTVKDRIMGDVGTISSFRSKKGRLYQDKKSPSWKRSLNLFFGSDYRLKRKAKRYLSRFDRLNTENFNPIGKFKNMLDRSSMWEYYKDKVYDMPWRLKRSIGRAKLTASTWPNLWALDKTVSARPILFDYYRRGFGVSFLLRSIRLSRTIAVPGGALHKLLARRKRRARARVIRKQRRPLSLPYQGYGGLRLVKDRGRALKA